MKRVFENRLEEWKKSGMKKPLMVLGVRQIGKTYTIENFCKESFQEYYYFNLEKEKNIYDIFEHTIDEAEIIKNIELCVGKKIDIENTIFFFDEVQVSEKFITSLKYFCESPKNYKIVCAGSLLGVKINRFESSFPVGKVKMEYMYPMSFEEFLLALGKELLIEEIEESYREMKPMPDFAHEEAIKLYRQYLCVGGMPEAVQNFVNEQNDILSFDQSILSNIVKMYIADMNKYTISNIESVKIEKIYKNVPIQLAKENKKFKYSVLEESANKRKYQSAIDWLVAGNMVLPCYDIVKPDIPLKVFMDENTFKLYLSDVGLLVNMSELKLADIILDNDFLFKGAITENYIAQEFTAKGVSLYYWKNDRSAELDYMVYNDGAVIPVEVKSSKNNTSKSLQYYVSKYKPKYSIRISTKNFGFENNIKSIPLYAVFCLARELKE